MPNNKITTTDLDFDAIKQNLKVYLQGQQKFSDYDFDGSGLSILLDVLAVNTHYNGLYNNLAVNEAFLDSASKRSSVVSKAKELGYVPMSARSATARVKVLLVDNRFDAEPVLEIPVNTQFTTTINGVEYTFYTTGTHIAYRSGTNYVFSEDSDDDNDADDGIEIKEGRLLHYEFEADGINNIFTIPNSGIDTTTLRVIVQENAQTSTYDTYLLSSSMLNIDGQSKVYFLKETDDNFYQIEFGNGVIGKALVAGNVVKIDYMVSSADLPNGARVFKYTNPPSPTTAYVTTVTPAYGGSIPENLTDIKWNAPRMYAAQNRCVTLDDYRAIINSLYPNADTINVWGGESNDPPEYGKVFISIKPQGSERLSRGEKNHILDAILAPRKVVTMHPEIEDPIYLYVELNTTFYYNPDETTRTAASLTALVRNSILGYNDTLLSKFGGILKYSTLSRYIDSSEGSIKNSISTMILRRAIEPVYNTSTTYTIELGNKIHNAGICENSVLSNKFNVLNQRGEVQFDDVPRVGSSIGDIRLFYMDGADKKTVKNIGTVDYETGKIIINSLVITGISESELHIKVKPSSNDVISSKNQIVLIAPENVKITPRHDGDADSYEQVTSR